MTNFPVSLGSLIDYVAALRPDAPALEHLSDAVAVAGRVDEQADALIGHFVDQARRAGASWAEIGAGMGVSKQAAQQRFVPKWDGSDPIPEGQLFSRVTQRARNVLAAAHAGGGRGAVGAQHIAVALLTEPEGLAAMILLADRRTKTSVSRELGAKPKPGGHADPAALREIEFADDGQDVLRRSLAAALHLGHNFIGTEHLLLGVLAVPGGTADALGRLGVTAEGVEQSLADMYAQLKLGAAKFR